MTNAPAQITLEQWDERYRRLAGGDSHYAGYAGPLQRHERDGDFRLRHLRFDNSAAALRLWNFLLTEEQRLRAAKARGCKVVGVMKDLGTVPVMAYSLPNMVAFYPDGAWWVPCIMEMSTGDLEIADRLGIDESFCPVRAMLGAFARGAHFPRPDLLVCSAGAVCDDFSAISQRLAAMGFPILWWEIPHRRNADGQVAFIRAELGRVREALGSLAGRALTDEMLADGITHANRFRRRLNELRRLVYTTTPCPLGALEMLIVEMLAIHFCSDRAEAIAVVEELLQEVRRRVAARAGVLDAQAVGVFWVNPVADLKAMNLLEQCGGRLCGTEFLFTHAMDEIATDLPPMEALARAALADPMVGPASQRAERIVRDCRLFGARAVVVSRIPGASHCAGESLAIARAVRDAGLPVVEIEVPPLCDSMEGPLRTRLGALVESARPEENRH